MTSPARTSVDLAAFLSPARLRRFVESAVVEKRCTLAEVGSIHARVRRSGKRGVRSLERVLDAIGPGDAISRTELEIRKVAPSGRTKVSRYNPFWAKFQVDRHREYGITSMAVTGEGRRTVFGSFLNPDDRESFARAFTSALASVKRRI